MPESTKSTLGSATPLPHILYSALSEWGFFSHLIIWFLLLGLEDFPMTERCVSNTSVQNLIYSSDSSSVSNPAHHQSGKPCSLAHSVGVSLRTMYSGSVSFTTGGSL